MEAVLTTTQEALACGCTPDQMCTEAQALFDALLSADTGTRGFISAAAKYSQHRAPVSDPLPALKIYSPTPQESHEQR